MTSIGFITGRDLPDLTYRGSSPRIILTVLLCRISGDPRQKMAGWDYNPEGQAATSGNAEKRDGIHPDFAVAGGYAVGS